MSLFVAGAVLGEGQVSLFVAGAVLGGMFGSLKYIGKDFGCFSAVERVLCESVLQGNYSVVLVV